MFGVSNIMSSMEYVKAEGKGGCLLSLDFFKAYDRVFLGFLLKVMDRMNFGQKFCQWISMLHANARTCFVLEGMTRFIDLTFSIRQGDPLSMVLYILYVEPLLVYIENRITGLSFPSPRGSFLDFEKDEAYCDDLNVVTEDVNDLIIVDQAVGKFESLSGALLSRGNKCKIFGFGCWKKRTSWPLAYVECVNELKIFGIIFTDSYRTMLRRNWDYRITKFEQSVISWSTRSLETIFQKIEVLKTFAMSRLFYIGSILPLPEGQAKKIDRIIGKFIWMGKLMRVPLAELQLPHHKGGGGLICIRSMAKSLRLSHFLRLLKNGESRTLSHIQYWIGEVIDDLIPGMALGEHGSASQFFDDLATLVTDARIGNVMMLSDWKRLTNKAIYLKFIVTFPSPRVELNAGYSFSRVWWRLNSPVLNTSCKGVLYLLIHNKLPVKERLFRLRMAPDPYCEDCYDYVGAVTGDIAHCFAACRKVASIWSKVRRIVTSLLGPISNAVPCINLLSLQFPGGEKHDEAVWIIGQYVSVVWESLVSKERSVISEEKFFGHLKFKYRLDQCGARLPLGQILSIS